MNENKFVLSGFGGGKFIMRDILDDDERKVKPLTLLMLSTSAVLGAMIVYNTMFAQPHIGRLSAVVGASTGINVSAPAAATNTVVFKYDATVEEVQRELLATGQFKGLVDGVNGQKTKIAVQQYQQEAGLLVTGEITPDLINQIRFTRKVKAASEYTGSVEPAPAAPESESPLAHAALISSTQPIPAEPALPMAKTTAQNTRVLNVQRALEKKGYSVGEINGQMTPETRAAILQFELDNGLAMDGIVDPPLLAALASK